MRPTGSSPSSSCLGTGVLLAAALPPWGWWPLAFAGVVCLDRLIADRPRWARFRRGSAIGLGLYVPSLAWMIDMTAPGYVIAAVAYAALLGVAVTVVPATAPGRWLALPGAIALTELLRWSWPFGGVPLSSLAVGQVGGPLAPVLRVGGSLLLVEVTVVVGVALAALVARRWVAAAVAARRRGGRPRRRHRRPPGAATGDDLRVALVQGGGPQGTRAWNTDEREVFERHLEASELVETPGRPRGVARGRGRRRRARDVAGGPGAVRAGPRARRDPGRGRGRGRGRRALPQLPPWRTTPTARSSTATTRCTACRSASTCRCAGCSSRSAAASLTERDAVIGEHPARLDTPAGRLGVAISWEIFFGDRVREGVQDGAEIVLNPTNGSSFSGTLVQTQQVASSRMRAIENDRWVLQVAPTGFTAIVDPDGTVDQRTAVSEQRVLQGTVELRQGTTLYTRFGYGPAVIASLASLALGWWVARRSRRRGAGRGSDLDEDGDRPVVDEGDAHVGAEPPGRHLSPEPT